MINEAKEAESKRIVEDSEEVLELLRDAQEKMRDAASSIATAKRDLERLPMGVGSRTAERIYRYIQGHLEPLIDKENDWLSKSTNLQDVIDEIKEIIEDFEGQKKEED